MADTKLSALTELAATPADNDEVYIRDVSELASTESKRITIANLLAGAVGATIIRKTADETVNNSEVLQNDNHLVLPVGADDVWLIYLVLYSYSPTSTPDIDYLFAVPSGGAVRIMDDWSRVLASGLQDGTAEQTMAITGGAERWMQLFLLYIGGGTGGNLQFQWAQNVATAEDTKIKLNSLMLCHQIA